MDQPLSSYRGGGNERRDFNSQRRGGGGGHRPPQQHRGDYRSGGGGRGGNYRGGGGGFHHPRDAPYGRGGRGRGGGRGHRPTTNANRFFAEAPLPPDAASVARRNLTNMLVRLGHWDETAHTTRAAAAKVQMEQQQATEVATDDMQDEKPQAEAPTPPAAGPIVITMDALVATQRSNMQSLATVIAKKPQVFLTFATEGDLKQLAKRAQMAPPQAPESEETGPSHTVMSPPSRTLSATALAGPLATSLVNCVTGVSPLSIPIYAGLTACVEATTAASEFSGVAARTVHLSVATWCQDLDAILLVTNKGDGMASDRPQYLSDTQAAWRRVKAVTRYWCSLAAAGVLQTASTDTEEDPVPTAVQGVPVTATGLVRALVQAAQLALQSDATYVAWRLVTLAMSLVPLLRAYALVTEEWLQEHMLGPLAECQGQLAYTSEYIPGQGRRALLLQGEQREDIVVGGEEEESDDEDDDLEEEGGAAAKLCDSWQEMMQAITASDSTMTDGPTLALWTTRPWPTKDDTSDGSALRLGIYPACQSLTLLLGGHLHTAEPDPDQPRLVQTPGRLALDDYDVVGRLPIFGGPQSGEASDEEEDEDEGPVNPRLLSYRQNYGLLDRVYLADAMRDILAAHQVVVTETGVEKGTIKSLAEHLWSLRQVHPSPGMEYLLVEVLLSLICQLPANGSGSLLGHSVVSLTRVLVELTKLDPSLMASVLVQAVHTLVEDYMPALTPTARHSLSQWFALHLISTQYQWPAQYWQHWEPFVLYGWKNSRGAFCKRTLQLVLENQSQPEDLVRDHPHLGRKAVSAVPEQTADDKALESLTSEVFERIHTISEDPSLLLEYLTSDELSESTVPTLSSPSLWRTTVMGRALVVPLWRYNERVTQAIEKAQSASMQEGEGDDEMESAITLDDALPSVLEALTRYETFIVGILNKEKEELGSEDTTAVEMALLSAIYEYASFSPTVVDALFRSLQESNVVQATSLVVWSLQSGPVLRWWETASAAMRIGMHGIFDITSDYGTMDETDDSTTSLQRKVDKIVSFLQPFLESTLQLVVELLEKSLADSSNKLSPEEVDLLEGTKHIICLAHVLFCDRIWKEGDSPDPLQTVKDTVDQSSVGKDSLLAMVTGGSKPVELLREIITTL